MVASRDWERASKGMRRGWQAQDMRRFAYRELTHAPGRHSLRACNRGEPQ